jgi:single-strand DNA-binding protein
MANVNKVFLIGHLTRDPEIRHTPKGTAIAEFGLAINRNYTNDQGEKCEDVTFVDITVWGKTAEIAGKYLSKGRQVYLEGRLQFSTWDDKQTGQKRSKLRVVGETIEFLGDPSGGTSQQPPERNRQESPISSAPPQAPDQPKPDNNYEIDEPF